MFESTKIIAYKQYFKARQLFLDESSQQPLRGPIKYVHEHIDMTKQVVPLYKSAIELANRQQPKPTIALNSTYRTCPAGLGYSFAAGTTDGPGAFDFQQGDTASTRYWNMVRDFLRRPSESQIKCHHPKPILLSTGEMDFPYMWHPKVVPTQLFLVGQLAIVGLPGEFTTMAGRRVRNAVRETLLGLANQMPDDLLVEDSRTKGLDSSEEDEEAMAAMSGKQRRRRSRAAASDIKVALSGLSNIYTSYVTTLEEYEIQRYEGASTLYGPHTLQAYVNQFKKLAGHLASGTPLENNQLEPPDLTKSLFTLKAGVIFDGTQKGRSFGQPITDANTSRPYKCQETVTVSFVAGNPRNDLRQEDSFIYVDRYSASNATWTPIASDASWETKFIWERTNTIFGESRALAVWDIPHDCQPGVYRIRHYGAHKNLLQKVSHYSGQSSPFKVTSDESQVQLAELDALLNSAIVTQQAALAAQGTNQRRLQADQRQQASGQPSMYSPFSLLSSWFGSRRSRS